MTLQSRYKLLKVTLASQLACINALCSHVSSFRDSLDSLMTRTMTHNHVVLVVVVDESPTLLLNASSVCSLVLPNSFSSRLILVAAADRPMNNANTGSNVLEIR